MKKLRSLLEILQAEIEAEGVGILDSGPSRHSSHGMTTLPPERARAVGEKLRALVQDLQMHQVELEARDRLRNEELARIAKLSRFQDAEIKALVESLPDAVLIGTTDGLAICNSAALRVFGARSIEELRSPQPRTRLFPLRSPEGDPIKEEELPFVRALREDSLIEEYVITDPDTGAEVRLRAAAGPIWDSGEIVGTLTIFTDVTEKRREAEELREACERADRLYADLGRQTAELNAVLDAIPDGVYLGDLQGIRRCNIQGLRLLGAKDIRELNMSLADLIRHHQIRPLDSEELLDPEESTFARAMRGESCTHQLQHTDPCTGRLRILRSSGAPVFMNETVVAAVTVTTDISDQVNAKMELEAVNSRLDQIVQERTRELTEANTALEKALAEISALKERVEAENAYLHLENDRQYNFGEVIGHCSSLKEVFYRIEAVAPQDTTVLLLGETGTGKGMMARAIHARSARKDHPMVMVNCTALPANLIESELFGREKGAFTGAHSQQIGRFELADKGTIFLDEIGDLPLELQAKLLHVLQEKEFSRLGSPRTIKVDVRIIAATNRDLKEEMAQGRFREDLYYRLSTFPVTIPPLRERKQDIPLLVEHFLGRFCREMGKQIVQISAATMNKLVNHAWPGNVRELENVLERAVITTRGDTLQLLDRLDPPPTDTELETASLQTLAEVERAHILKALKQTKGRIDGKNGAALLLGLNPSTLRGRMRKEGIQRFEWV